jgi:hypothetical protein
MAITLLLLGRRQNNSWGLSLQASSTTTKKTKKQNKTKKKPTLFWGNKPNSDRAGQIKFLSSLHRHIHPLSHISVHHAHHTPHTQKKYGINCEQVFSFPFNADLLFSGEVLQSAMIASHLPYFLALAPR